MGAPVAGGKAVFGGDRLAGALLAALCFCAQPASSYGQAACDEWPDAAFFEVAEPDDVTACIDRGVSVTEADSEGFQPIHMAARANDDAEIIRRLVAAGASIEAATPEGVTPLLIASRRGAPTAMIETMLTLGADPNAADSRLGYTPLLNVMGHDAALASVDLLLAAGADVNQATTSDGRTTPLLAALLVVQGFPVIERLVAAGAHVNAASGIGSRPLDIAARLYDNPAVPALLIDAGADLESRNAINGDTALHAAARNESAPAAMIEVLLDAGADRHATNDQGELAADIAAENPLLTGTGILERLSPD